MKNQKSLAYITTFALCICSLGHIPTPTAQAEESTCHTFQRVITGQNGSLQRYNYIDDQGNEVIPANGEQSTNLKKATNIPSSYDSRDAGVITSIKDQGITGSCWAFGALKSLEASSISQGLSVLEETDYSESHLSWYSYIPLKDSTHPLYGDYIDTSGLSDADLYNMGGSAYLSLFTLANWWGAVKESDALFSAASTSQLKSMAASMRNQPDSFRFQSEVQLKAANCYDSAISGVSRSKIKEAIMEHGALDVALYYDNSNIYQDEDITSIYQNEYDSSYANHCVTIIGWDDDFNTFSSKPRKSGAWLIANSYGEDSGMDGYFWLSYYDTSICEVFSFEAQEADTYDTNFQYDGLGWYQGYYDIDDISIANIFTNKTATPQSICAASFYTYGNEQEYRIELYRNVTGYHPLNGEPVSICTTSGTAEWAGYHTIPLENSIAVAPGESFSIVVTFIADSAPDNTVYALVEGPSLPESGTYFNSQKGQSFIYFASEDTWYDNTAYTEEDSDEVFNMNNVCVKAFSNEMTQEEFTTQEENYIPESPVPMQTITPNSTPTSNPYSTNAPVASYSPAPTNSPSPTHATGYKPFGNILIINNKMTIGKGEKVKLNTLTTPTSDAKILTYTSSNSNLVQVSSNGKITGKAVGKATITIESPSGAKATAQITVKKAPKSVKATVNKKKIKIGKTAKIKVKLNKGSASYKLTYKALNPKIAKVNAKGKIKAKKKGTAKFRITTYNKKKATVKIKVR